MANEEVGYLGLPRLFSELRIPASVGGSQELARKPFVTEAHLITMLQDVEKIWQKTARQEKRIEELAQEVQRLRQLLEGGEISIPEL